MLAFTPDTHPDYTLHFTGNVVPGPAGSCVKVVQRTALGETTVTDPVRCEALRLLLWEGVNRTKNQALVEVETLRAGAADATGWRVLDDNTLEITPASLTETQKTTLRATLTSRFGSKVAVL